MARVQVASVEHAASRLPMLTLAQVRSVSGVAHCILEWVVALHGYYWAHRAMVTARPTDPQNLGTMLEEHSRILRTILGTMLGIFRSTPRIWHKNVPYFGNDVGNPLRIKTEVLLRK